MTDELGALGASCGARAHGLGSTRARAVRPTARMDDRRRILVVGSGGAGKSTFARELARRTGLPLVHLDLHYWKPGWTPTPPDEWLGRVRDLVRGDRWIIDGNYVGSLALRLERCDGVVFFDLPRLICLGGIARRWLRHQVDSPRVARRGSTGSSCAGSGTSPGRLGRESWRRSRHDAPT